MRGLVKIHEWAGSFNSEERRLLKKAAGDKRLESINQRRVARGKKPLGFGGGSQPRHPAGSSKGGQWS